MIRKTLESRVNRLHEIIGELLKWAMYTDEEEIENDKVVAALNKYALMYQDMVEDYKGE